MSYSVTHPSLARSGLDIPSVDIVINFDIPTHSKDYIHRVGRTARAGRAGKSITFVTHYDVEFIMRIEKVIGKKMELWPTDEEEVSLLRERVGEECLSNEICAGGIETLNQRQGLFEAFDTVVQGQEARLRS